MISKGALDLSRVFALLNGEERFQTIPWKEELERSAVAGLFSSEMDEKRMLFELLTPYAETLPPWGILTGVRPSKRYRELRKQYGRLEARKSMHERDRVSFSKIKKLEAIYEATSEIRVEPQDIIVYIHIPFCPSRCTYCSFTSYVSNEKDDSRRLIYGDHLLREMESALELLHARKIRALYIGGGTPTMLSAKFYEKVLAILKPYFSDDVEITIEAGRVDTFDGDDLYALREIGCTRISINPQTFTKSAQKKIRRELDERTFEKLFAVAKELFTVNMDLIAGLPGETEGSFRATLERALYYGPDNLSIHALAKKAKAELTSEEIGVIEFSEPKDYTPYYLYRQKDISGAAENTGYTLPGHLCLYNVLVMEEWTDVLGFGVGAVSHFTIGDQRFRIPNTKDLTRYFNGHYQTLLEKRQQKKSV